MRVKKIVREDWWANNLSTGRMCLGQLVRISTNSHPIHNIFYMAYALGIQYGHLHYGLCSGAVPACNRCGPCRRPFYSTSTLLFSISVVLRMRPGCVEWEGFGLTGQNRECTAQFCSSLQRGMELKFMNQSRAGTKYSIYTTSTQLQVAHTYLVPVMYP